MVSAARVEIKGGGFQKTLGKCGGNIGKKIWKYGKHVVGLIQTGLFVPGNSGNPGNPGVHLHRGNS